MSLASQQKNDNAADVVAAILELFRSRGSSQYGFEAVTQLEHALQSATLGWQQHATSELISAALLHDIGDDLAPMNHSDFAAAILKPYVRDEVHWVVSHHGLFQMAYCAHHLGKNPSARERYRGHPYYDSCVRFCERWDQPSFDPDYPTPPLEHFAPKVRAVISPHHIQHPD